ncbi:MAG TPA: RNA polymerase sigma factor [Thermoanaerobaculia bacterium]|nr:RNA polymerase sigma factor [Thermoanaerobaculia bacterium]
MSARNSLTGGETLHPQTSLDGLALSVHRRAEGAFERLVGHFEKPLFNYVLRLVPSQPDAQEVVQDTFLRAHRALTRQYSSERCDGLALRPWLFRIARNLSHNKRRGLRHRVECRLEAAHDQRPDAPHGAIAVLCRVEQREELERLDRAMASLPLESRELVVLRFIEEMSYAEIAATTGQGEAALRGKVFRALKQLRDALARQEDRHAM